MGACNSLLFRGFTQGQIKKQKPTMRKQFPYIVLISSLLCFAPSMCRAESIDSIFARVPSAVLPLLDRTAKLDMLDLYNNHLRSVVENVYGGQAEMLRKSDTEVSIRTSDVGQWTLILLAAESDTTILCLHSLRIEGTETSTRSYNLQWQPLPNIAPRPSTENLMNLARSISANLRSTYRHTLAGAPIEVVWNDSLRTLTYSISCDGLSSEESAWARQSLTPATWRWNAHGHGSFVPQVAAEEEQRESEKTK